MVCVQGYQRFTPVDTRARSPCSLAMCEPNVRVTALFLLKRGGSEPAGKNFGDKVMVLAASQRSRGLSEHNGPIEL